jgi:hypothetical protein
MKQDLFKPSFVKVLQEFYILAKHKRECTIFAEVILASQRKQLYVQPNVARTIIPVTQQLTKMGVEITTALLPAANKNLNATENSHS